MDPVNLEKAPLTHLKLAEQAAEHLLMAPVAFLAEQEVHLVGLLLHLEVLEMIKIEGTALKLKISHSEDTTLAILCGCLYLLAYYL